jgi:tRNA (Thr-GGU) A37 N-methylase
MDTTRRVNFQPIGIVRTRASEDEIREHRRDQQATIEIFPAYQDGLEGLSGFSHIFVLSYLDRLRPEQKGVLKVKPRRL